VKKITIKLSEAEINHILAHLEANGQITGMNYDWYYGDLKKFEKIHEQVKQKLKDTLNIKGCKGRNKGAAS